MHDKPCPKCGHCPTCGRSNATPYGTGPNWPWTYPRYPYGTNPYPYATWTVKGLGAGGNYMTTTPMPLTTGGGVYS